MNYWLNYFIWRNLKSRKKSVISHCADKLLNKSETDEFHLKPSVLPATLNNIIYYLFRSLIDFVTTGTFWHLKSCTRRDSSFFLCQMELVFPERMKSCSLKKPDRDSPGKTFWQDSVERRKSRREGCWCLQYPERKWPWEKKFGRMWVRRGSRHRPTWWRKKGRDANENSQVCSRRCTASEDEKTTRKFNTGNISTVEVSLSNQIS